MDNETKETILKILEMAGFNDVSIEVICDDFFKIKRFNIRTEQAGILIGERGEHIRDLETVFRFLKPIHQDSEYRFVLDVNGYRLAHEGHIKTIAQEAMRRVLMNKQPVALEPMSAYERKIVHMELALHPDISTESEGDGFERRVIIKPYIQPESKI